MFSRAHIIIEQQIEEANKVPAFRICQVNQNSVFELIAQIRGQAGTLWEEGIFQVYMKFDENYNDIPPKIWFLTIPYHPNIDQVNGCPNLDFLDDLTKWRLVDQADRTIKNILYNVQVRESKLLDCFNIYYV